MKKIFYIIFLVIFFSIKINAEYICFYPDISTIEKYVDNFVNLVNVNDKQITIYKVNNNVFFPTPVSILQSLQSNQINFALIPLYVFSRFNINNKLNPLLLKIYKKDNVQTEISSLIPLKILLQKYSIFLIDIIPIGKYYIFSDKILRKGSKEISIAILDPLLKNKLKKFFPNIFIVDNLQKLKKYLKDKFFTSALLTVSDYVKLNRKFKYVYSTNLPKEKLALLTNYNYWNNLNLSTKSLIWSFIYKNKLSFIADHKKFKDSILNKLNILSSGIH